MSEHAGWDDETAEGDGGVERWGEEGFQVGQGQDADANWGSGTAQAWEAESNQPQWEEPQSVRGARGCGGCVEVVLGCFCFVGVGDVNGGHFALATQLHVFFVV